MSQELSDVSDSVIGGIIEQSILAAEDAKAKLISGFASTGNVCRTRNNLCEREAGQNC